LDALEELRERLEECVRLRLESDVPLGAFLSGGTDSSLIVALLTKLGVKTKTFSIGFEDTSYNELPYARLVADRYDTDHHEFMVRPELLGIAPNLAWHYGEPYADSSAIPTYELARLASDHITVALNGDGGDETFAGYRRYRAQWAKHSYDQLPKAFRETVGGGFKLLPAATRSRGLLYDFERFFGKSDELRQTQYASWFGFFGDRRADLNPAFAEATDREALAELEDAFSSGGSLHPVDAAMRADVSLYLPDDLLVKVDIATMAHGLEARSPLLDHTLMEFVARLPVEFKLNFFQGKTLLRRVAKGLIPDDILRRKKTGFGVPLDQWFRGEFGNSAREILLASNAHVQEYVDAVTIKRLFDEHCELRAAHGHRLWALYMLEQWKTVCSVRPTVANFKQRTGSNVLDRDGF
jgi:asparagine synthase (glutamine-hydrolysing)